MAIDGEARWAAVVNAGLVAPAPIDGLVVLGRIQTVSDRRSGAWYVHGTIQVRGKRGTHELSVGICDGGGERKVRARHRSLLRRTYVRVASGLGWSSIIFNTARSFLLVRSLLLLLPSLSLSRSLSLAFSFSFDFSPFSSGFLSVTAAVSLFLSFRFILDAPPA
jgi:hypothetical protein